MIRVFKCELDVDINEVSESFTFSLKSKYIPNILMNQTCTQTSNNFLMKLIRVIVKYCI